ncbi:leucine-rich repeat, immunoglobulin-like domain-containing kekkon 5 protein [Halictus rubicundus]|uniref:leucine-rich repeat, immunoglobulin-like domain-containing kekkon 5 protein n=1 Tax=Halictus rubicundus TaxID=77578 RepID=UPI0040361B39
MELGAARLLLYSTLMVVVCWSYEDWSTRCSPACKCTWANGKRTAECINRNLTEIPSNLSSEIQRIDLTGNRISQLSYNSFSRVSLVNLHKLVMQRCEIESVHTNAFNGLKIVIEIDLSSNRIRTLYPGTFNETEKLRTVLLDNNKLKVLENGLFRDLIFLQKVTVSNNELERVDERAFHNVTKLQKISLQGNRLSTLRVESFAYLPNLGSLELQNNPWNCNCHLKEFRDWTIERKLYTKPTKCHYPQALADQMWDEIGTDQFACMPEIALIGPPVRIETSKVNVTFWCKATGTPQPKLSWIHRSRLLTNETRRHNGERGYVLKSSGHWLNLTIPDVTASDKGDYICQAKSPGGDTDKNVTLTIAGDAIGGKDSIISLPLALGLGVMPLLLLVATVSLCVCYCRRRRTRHDEKSLEAASIEHHGLGEQEKSLITTINPVVKPPRRYEAPSVTSHGTEMTELNRTLLDNDSVFADGIGSGVGGGVIGGVGDDEREERATPELESGTGTLCRGGGGSYRQYPPDLLAFSGGRGASPTSQASTAPDNTRLPSQHATPTTSAFGSPSNQYPAAFKTLPHNRSVTPYGIASSTIAPVMPRHGYVTIPRRPRAPSWSSGPPTSPTDALEPVYDNLGVRSTADGSSMLSLNKSPEPLSSIRNRPLPVTPGSLYGTIQRSTPNILTSSPLDRSAPEGAAEWPAKLADESTDSNHVLGPQQSGSNTLGRKVPPRPPPKPKKKSTNGPLYEDEGEDGTEV